MDLGTFQAESFGELQRLVDGVFTGRDAIERLDSKLGRQLLDLDDDLMEIVSLVPPGRYDRTRPAPTTTPPSPPTAGAAPTARWSSYARLAALPPAAGDVHVREAYERRGHRTGKDRRLRRQELGGDLGEREPGDQDRHGEADAAQDADAGDVRPPHALGKRRDAGLDQQERDPEDAQGLAEEHAEVHAEGDRVERERPEVDADEAHLGVDEGEDRQDKQSSPESRCSARDAAGAASRDA